MKYIRDNNGKTIAKIDFFSVIEDGKVWCYVYENGWFCKLRHLKAHYRPERTWDDHMGNTPCGYYVNAPLSRGKTKRVYIYD